MSLAFSCLTFLTTIWGEGVVFTWLLNVTGISALLVWTSIGFISLRFRHAYKAQGLSLSDLPYEQPLFPLLPFGIIVLGTLMFIAQGYSAARRDPFDARVRLRSNCLLRSGYEYTYRTWLRRTLALPSMLCFTLVTLPTSGFISRGKGTSFQSWKSTLLRMRFGGQGMEQQRGTGISGRARRSVQGAMHHLGRERRIGPG